LFGAKISGQYHFYIAVISTGMNRRRDVSTRFVGRRIGVVFGVLIAIPLSLALVEIYCRLYVPKHRQQQGAERPAVPASLAQTISKE
jgi:hypothetical protein